MIDKSAKRFVRRMQRAWAAASILDLPTEKPTVFLAASGRSGSTWLQNIIAATGRYRVIFEPFNNRNNRRLRDWHYRQYISPLDDAEPFYRSARQIVRGVVRGHWFDQDNEVLVPNARLIKAIRANLCLAWLKQRFPEVKFVYLLRHPFAVTESRLSLGWGLESNDLMSQQELIEQHFDGERAWFDEISDPFVRSVAFWIIENLVPLRELQPGDAHVITYEDLVADPDGETRRLLTFLGKSDFPMEQLQVATQQPSRTVNPEKNRAKMTFSEDQIAAAVALLQRFGLDGLYDQDVKRPPRLAEREILSEFS